MCNIWQQKIDTQITPAQLTKALSNPLFSEVRGVGINGGEPTLRADLAELVNILYEKLPKLNSISLITNAFNSKQVIERINEVGEVVKKHSGYLDVMVSLDGVSEIHDQVRGRKGNFINAVKVIDFIKSSALVHNARLGCTVIKDNVFGLHDLLEFARSKDIYVKYRVGIPHQRLYSKDKTDPFSLTYEEKYHLAVFLMNLINNYEKSEQQKYFYQSLVDQLMYNKPRAAGCDWQHRGATLTARGELMYCAVESKILGSAIEEDANRLYTENHQHLAEIVNTKCGGCLHDYMGLPPFKILVRSYLKQSLKKAGIANSQRGRAYFERLRGYKHRQDFRNRLISDGVKLVTHSLPKPGVIAPSPKTTRRKVLICGWYGTETLGDKAILGGVIAALQAAFGELTIHLTAIEPYISTITAQQMPELASCTIYSLEDGIKAVEQMDLVVFGGGPIMAINELSPMLAMFQKAAAQSIPTIIAGCGVGPLGQQHHNQAIKLLLEYASVRIYRDQKSMQVASALGIDTSVDIVAEDPALTWLQLQRTTKNPDARPYRQDDERPKLLLGLRDWPYHEYARDLRVEEAQRIKLRCEQQIVEALERLLMKYPDLLIMPFPMCTNHIGGDDRWFYRDLFRGKQRLQNSLAMDLLERELNPIQAVQVFLSANVALTMRFHSLVFALGLGVPSVSIDYTLGKGKVKSLADKHEVPQMGLDLVTSEFLYDSIVRQLSGTSGSTSIVTQPTLLFSDALKSFLSPMVHA